MLSRLRLSLRLWESTAHTNTTLQRTSETRCGFSKYAHLGDFIIRSMACFVVRWSRWYADLPPWQSLQRNNLPAIIIMLHSIVQSAPGTLRSIILVLRCVYTRTFSGQFFHRSKRFWAESVMSNDSWPICNSCNNLIHQFLELFAFALLRELCSFSQWSALLINELES